MGKTIKRPGWHEYFMSIAELVATRSTCLSRQVGAVLVKDKRALATGYNGVPKGITHCEKVGCLRQKLNVPSGERHELCRGLHAEQNAIIQAALHGVSVAGSEIYSTVFPCVVCSKMLINAGVRRVIYMGDYPDKLSKRMLEEAKVKVIRYGGSKEKR
jgi:dCMP deaminase